MITIVEMGEGDTFSTILPIKLTPYMAAMETILTDYCNSRNDLVHFQPMIVGVLLQLTENRLKKIKIT